jgi:hypothetical protein
MMPETMIEPNTILTDRRILSFPMHGGLSGTHAALNEL